MSGTKNNYPRPKRLRLMSPTPCCMSYQVEYKGESKLNFPRYECECGNNHPQAAVFALKHLQSTETKS